MPIKSTEEIIELIKLDDSDEFFKYVDMFGKYQNYVYNIIEYKAKKISKEICNRSFQAEDFQTYSYVQQFVRCLDATYDYETEEESNEIVDLIMSFDFSGINIIKVISSIPFTGMGIGYPLRTFIRKALVFVQDKGEFQALLWLISKDNKV